MTYDLRGEMDLIAGHHSPLFFGKQEEGEEVVFNSVSEVLVRLMFIFLYS
jgi:hypothetical protein